MRSYSSSAKAVNMVTTPHGGVGPPASMPPGEKIES
jgi:hypothetical protein